MIDDSSVVSDMVLKLTSLKLLGEWRKEIESAIEQVKRPVVDFRLQRQWYWAQTRGMRWRGGDEAQKPRTGKPRKR